VQGPYRREQLSGPERLGQIGDAVRKQARVSAGDHQAPAGRRRVLREHGLDQIRSPLGPQVGVDEYRVIPGWIHLACLGQRGRVVHQESVEHQRAADERSHRIEIIDYQNPLDVRILAHCAPVTADG
jgi:hypothetical protein